MTDTGVHSKSCPAELTCAMYADGELSVSEAKLLREHLDRCPRCHALVLAFQAERETLVGFLGDADAFLAESEPVPVPASSHVPVPAASPVPVPASSHVPVQAGTGPATHGTGRRNRAFVEDGVRPGNGPSAALGTGLAQPAPGFRATVPAVQLMCLFYP